MGKVSFEIKRDRVFYRTIIEDSTIGHNSHFQSDVRIVKALIRPFTLVNESVVYHRLHPERKMELSCWLCFSELLAFLLDLFLLGKAAISVFVACLVWILLWDYVALETCVPICAASLAAQGLAWQLLFIILSQVRFLGTSRDIPTPFVPSIVKELFDLPPITYKYARTKSTHICSDRSRTEDERKTCFFFGV